MNNRAYSVIQWKSLDDDKRIIEGIATTPEADRVGDIVDSEGIHFKLPLPLLIHHDSKRPIGHVVSASPSKSGVAITAKVAASGISAYIDEAWAQIKAGLIRGLSIGFRSLNKPEDDWDKKLNGFRFTKTEWLELSAVTVPANQNANILTVKSLDTQARAASGHQRATVVRLDQTPSPGVTGKTYGKQAMTIKEQIAGLEAKRAASDARIEELIKKTADEGRTFEETEAQEYSDLETEVKSIDAHLSILKQRETRLVATAKAVTAQAGTSYDSGYGTGVATDVSRAPIQVKRVKEPAGMGWARIAIAMWHAKNNYYAAADLCRKHWPDQPELAITLKAIVEAADTTTSGWASQLVPAAQQLQNEFIDMYRDATIIDRIPGLRQVPFNTAVPIRTGAGTFQWVGEAAPKPVTSETFDRITLTWHKAAAITVITQELAKFSSPSAEMLIRNSMRETLIRFFDAHFISTTAAVSGISPAGILNGITPITASGTTAAAFRTDFNNLLNNFTANKVGLGQIVFIMSSTQAAALSLMVTDLGVALFPTLTRDGGTVMSFPVIITEAAGTKIIAIVPSDILIARDPGVTIKVSDQATIEMETAPAVGEQSPPSTQSVLKSMFQNNMLAILAEQFITWARARTSAVEYINGNAYVP